MTKKIRPTLKTIAQLTGLAIPTVSRALSGATDIGKATRERVRRVADEIGYIPNSAGVRLRTGQTFSIAFVMSGEADGMNISVRLLYAASRVFRDTPYSLNLTPFCHEEDQVETISRIVETGSADAIVLNQTRPEDPRVRYLIENKVPFATHGRTSWSEEHAYYEYCNEAFGRLAVQKLVERGRKNLKLLAPRHFQNFSIEMANGAREEAARCGVDLELLTTIDADQPVCQIAQEIQRIFSDEPAADGLISASSHACIASVRGLEDAGKKVGEGLDIVSKEVSPILHMFHPGVISQYEDTALAGEFLARAVLERIAHPDKPPMQFLEVPS